MVANTPVEIWISNGKKEKGKWSVKIKWNRSVKKQMIMHDITWGAAPGYYMTGFQPGKK